MNVYQYTALRNTMGAQEVVASCGMRPHPHPQALAQQLASCVARGGYDVLARVRDIHPDLELFQDQVDKYKDKYRKEKDDFMEKHFSNASGQTIKAEVEGLRDGGSNSKDLLIVGGLVVVALAIVMRK